MRDFGRKVSESGRVTYNARGGAHDDLILSICIALFMATNKPTFHREELRIRVEKFNHILESRLRPRLAATLSESGRPQEKRTAPRLREHVASKKSVWLIAVLEIYLLRVFH